MSVGVRFISLCTLRIPVFTPHWSRIRADKAEFDATLKTALFLRSVNICGWPVDFLVL
jgi:hypothetical protein